MGVLTVAEHAHCGALVEGHLVESSSNVPLCDTTGNSYECESHTKEFCTDGTDTVCHAVFFGQNTHGNVFGVDPHLGCVQRRDHQAEGDLEDLGQAAYEMVAEEEVQELLQEEELLQQEEEVRQQKVQPQEMRQQKVQPQEVRQQVQGGGRLHLTKAMEEEEGRPSFLLLEDQGRVQ